MSFGSPTSDVAHSAYLVAYNFDAGPNQDIDVLIRLSSQDGNGTFDEDDAEAAIAEITAQLDSSTSLTLSSGPTRVYSTTETFTP